MNMKNLLPLLFVAIGCAPQKEPVSIPQRPWITIADRALEDWTPELAVKEAKKDIASSAMKIYSRGIVVAVAIGVANADQRFIQNLPWVNLSEPRESKDENMLKAQDSYATIYNSHIIYHLKIKRHLATSSSQSSRPESRR